MNKDISIIVILFKTPLEKIESLKQYKNFNLIIYEQSVKFSSKKKIKDILGFDFKYFSSNKNIGLSKAVNFLIDKTKTRYCLMTEPDITISEKSILNLKKGISKNKNFLLSGPVLIKKKIKDNKKSFNFKLSKNLDVSCVLFEVKIIKKFKFYDEDFFFYWEDIDLIKRINNSSYQMIIVQNSYAIHDASHSSISNTSVNILRNKNYKFGELMFDYKYKKLRKIKIIRQIFQNLLFSFFNIVLFNKKKYLCNIGYIFGIFKFIIYLLTKKINIKN